MDNFLHGVRMSSSADDSIAIPVSETSTVGVIITGDGADVTKLPLNKAVKITSFDEELFSAAGTTGTALSVLRTLTAQSIAPTTTVVRVPESEADLEANVLDALLVLEAASEGDTPIKLFAAPGLETVAVANSLGTMADTLGGFSYSAIQDADTMSDAVLSRNSYGNRSTMLLWPAEVKYAGETVHMAALALSARVLVDEKRGIAKTISNVVINGVDEIEVPTNFRGEQSPANQLNKHAITTIISKNGFRFWGNRTASSDEMFAFETDVRITHYIGAQVEQMMDDDIDDITTAEQLEDVVEKGQILMDNLSRGDDAVIIDGSFWIDGSQNDNSKLAKGGVRFDYDFGTYKPLEQPHFAGRITNSYISQVLPDFNTAEATTQV